MALKLLILGGTSEANQLAEALAPDPRFAVTLSLAGRTKSPRLPPVAVRVGGFGGIAGLTDYLGAGGAERTGIVIDATHPFAGQISRNAAAAAKLAGVPLVALVRPGWQSATGDRWTIVVSLEDAASALPSAPERIFLAVGRQSLGPFASRPQHHYLIRVIDPPEIPAAMTGFEIVTGRGPFQLEDEIELLRTHRIDRIVTKNSGGEAAYAKLAAARTLGLPVVMVERPAPASGGIACTTVSGVLEHIWRLHDALTKRSV